MTEVMENVDANIELERDNSRRTAAAHYDNAVRRTAFRKPVAGLDKILADAGKSEQDLAKAAAEEYRRQRQAWAADMVKAAAITKQVPAVERKLQAAQQEMTQARAKYTTAAAELESLMADLAAV